MKLAERFYIPDRTGRRDLLLPIVFFRRGDGGEADQMTLNGRREVAEEGQKLFTHPIAEEARIFVRGILTPLEALLGKEPTDGLSRQAQQRTNEARTGSGEDAAEAGRPRAAEEAEEDGFGLVGGGMTGRDPVNYALRSPLGEEPEPGLTARLLQIPHHSAPLRHMTGQISSQAPDEGLVGIGRRTAEAVVDVEDDQRTVMYGTEGVEEEDTVGAAGDGDSQRGAGELEPFERRFDLCEHVSR